MHDHPFLRTNETYVIVPLVEKDGSVHPILSPCLKMQSIEDSDMFVEGLCLWLAHFGKVQVTRAIYFQKYAVTDWGNHRIQMFWLVRLTLFDIGHFYNVVGEDKNAKIYASLSLTRLNKISVNYNIIKIDSIGSVMN